jgi:hypothetical protein
VRLTLPWATARPEAEPANSRRVRDCVVVHGVTVIVKPIVLQSFSWPWISRQGLQQFRTRARVLPPQWSDQWFCGGILPRGERGPYSGLGAPTVADRTPGVAVVSLAAKQVDAAAVVTRRVFECGVDIRTATVVKPISDGSYRAANSA